MIGHPLTETMILRRAQKDRLEKVKRVNLWGLRICDASLLQRVPTLEVISLSSNNISNLEPFSACVNLKELYLRNNSIFDLNEVRHLSGLSFLHTLFILGNPCCYPPNIEKINMQAETADHYRPTVIKHVPSLMRLDLMMVTEAERQASRQLIPKSFNSIDGDDVNITHENTTTGSQQQTDNQIITASGRNSEQETGQHVNNQRKKWITSNRKNELGVSQTYDNMPLSVEPSSWTLESIRQTISNLSLVHKQTLTEILHLLPRLNDDALALLANEIANRRRRQGDLITTASSKSTTPSP